MSAVAARWVSGFATVANIIATAIPYWLHQRISDNIAFYMGLWKICRPYRGQIVCYSIPIGRGFVEASRALEIVGIVLVAIALGLGLWKLTVMKESTMLLKVAGVCALSSGLSTIIGVIVFVAKCGAFRAGFSLHAGFGLATVGGIMAIVGGSMLFVSNRLQPRPQNLSI